MEINIKKQTLLISAVVASFIAIGLLLLRIYSLEHPSLASPQIPGAINLWAIFLTGLITGGLTCLAVQGGLLAATIAQREEQKLTDKSKNSGNALPILSFLIAKLVAYTALGFLLGWLGSVVQLSLTAKVVMQFAVVIFMLGTALNILNIHPIFRYFAIQPPKFLTRLVRKQSKRADLFAPILLGAFTVFIPCGTTQAMMALAIASGNPFLGAATMFSFILGTSPLFFILGFFATKLGDSMHQSFMKLAATVLILLALYNLDGALALSGSSFTFSTSSRHATQNTHPSAGNNITVNFTRTGYSSSNLSVKAGSLVTLHLNNSFTIPSYGIQKIVQMGYSDSVQFTAPSKPTTIAFMCSMGMYRGYINVI